MNLIRFSAIAVAAVFLSAISGEALCQSSSYRPGQSVSDTNPSPYKRMCYVGLAWLLCSEPNGGAASAAAQADQLTSTDSIGARLGDVAAPAAGSVNARILQTNSKLDTLHADMIAGTPGGELHIGEVGGRTIVTSANFTTPSGTTAYASGNLIANSATASSVTPLSWTACRVNGGTGMVRRVRVKTTDTGFVGQTVRVHLHQLSPTFTNGDHAALLTTDSNYLGSMDVTFDRTFSDVVKGFGIPNNGNEINFDCASTSQLLYGEVEARATITPQGGKVMTVVVEVLAN